MRNLTIKRTKSFAGCLAKLKVYIEDPFSGEITINGLSCRKLGDLKNGEEKTFSIGEEAARVFVIADKLSKDLWNEFYPLPAGQEDVSLSGKVKYNPATGNPFRFDNNISPQAVANRKRSSGKSLIVMIAAVILGGIVGYLGTTGTLSANGQSPKTFVSGGMSVTLTEAFKATEAEGFTLAYESGNVAVLALKEEFSLVEGFEDYTVEEYTDLVIEASGVDPVKRETGDGLNHFVYTATISSSQNTYVYYSYTYKAHDAFWVVQFAVPEENAETYEARILDWAKSVSFPEDA